MDPRTTTPGRATRRRSRADRSRRRPPAAVRRPGLYLGVAAAGALMVNVLVGTDGGAEAAAGTSESVSVAQQLGLTAHSGPAAEPDDLQPLEQLTASRSTREAAQTAAQQAQAAADQVELDRQQAAVDARVAAEAAEAAAAAKEAEEAARAKAAPAAASPAEEAAGAATPAAATAVARISNRAGGVRPRAQAAADAVVSHVPGARGITIGGTRASAADPSGHPSGLALDYMAGPALGDAIAQYQIEHWEELGVEYIIWQQRMLSSPSGSWKQMENRGSATANHMDHVHVNYRAG